jgi:hypothetical protein
MKEEGIKMEKLYNYIFHYNSHKEQWAAIPRGKEADYFNDMTGRVTTGILFAKDIDILVDFLSTKKEK